MKYMYTDGTFHSVDKNNVSTMMQAFNYGLTAFEGMRAFYRSKEKNWYLFRPDRHYARLCRSVRALGNDFPMKEREFVSAIGSLIRKNNQKMDLYIRPLVYRNALGVGLTKPSGVGVSIFTQSLPHPSTDPLRCCFVSQRRPVDGSYSVKLSGNYVLSYFSHAEAQRKGFDVGLLLSNDGFLSESSVMNLFFVNHGNLCTPSLDCGPLDGVTRRSIIELAKVSLSIKVREGKYRPAALLTADEVFLCGTGSGIISLARIESRRLKLKRSKLLAPQLQALYSAVIAGHRPEFRDWLVPV
jgi:branched-chain amino acid aminotransferase